MGKEMVSIIQKRGVTKQTCSHLRPPPILPVHSNVDKAGGGIGGGVRGVKRKGAIKS